MKHSVYLGLSILISINALILSYAQVTADRTCEEGEALVCFDENDMAFHVEENASISVEVLTDEYGQALVQLWNEKYPNHENALTYVVGSSEDADIKYLSMSSALFKSEEWMSLENKDKFNVLDKVATELNYNHLVFVPMAADGFAFISNIDKLSEQEIVMDDLDNDYLIDAVDSFTEIQAQFKDKQVDFNIMRLSLNEPYVFYPFLTAKNWEIFADNNAYDPGFEDASFLESLKFIESLSTYPWNGQSTQLSEAYQWDYITAMEHNDFAFSIVATWMFVDALEEKIEGNWQISHFPSYTEEDDALSPLLTNVYGYVLKQDVTYPSMAHEVLRMIRSIDGIEAFFTSTSVIPLYPTNKYHLLDLENNTRLQFSQALSYGQTEPIIAFENDLTQSAFSLYYEIEIMPIIRRLWDQEITAEEAQIEICMKSDEWLYQHELKISYDSLD